MVVSRRDFLGGVALALGGCARPAGDPGVLRFGYMANLTHAPAMAGVASGRLAAALGGLRLETRILGAGPRVVEALLGGTLDVAVAGPAAIVATHALHGPVLQVVAGVCSGGASFVLRDGERTSTLGGKTVATPQLGSTQDVSLRKLLRNQNDVRITQLSPAVAQIEMRRGHLAGAWLPEPWATRIVAESPAYRELDERDVWPGGRFATALVVVRTSFLRSRPTDVARLTDALAREVAAASPDESREALARVTRARWRPDVWSEAWKRVSFTSDTMREQVARFARDAADLGLLRAPVDVGTLFVA